MTLPDDIKIFFHKTIKGDITLDDFEKWLYSDKKLEKYLNPNDYQNIGLKFGLAIAAPKPADYWGELTTKQQKEILDSFSPELEKCIEQLIRPLETKN